MTITAELGNISSRFESARQLMRRRQEGVSAEITEVAWKAQNRLHRRYMKLMAAGKDQRKVITAIGRELMGFIWAIGIKAESACKQQVAA